MLSEFSTSMTWFRLLKLMVSMLRFRRIPSRCLLLIICRLRIEVQANIREWVRLGTSLIVDTTWWVKAHLRVGGSGIVGLMTLKQVSLALQLVAQKVAVFISGVVSRVMSVFGFRFALIILLTSNRGTFSL